MCLWGHDDTSSLRLVRVERSGGQIMKNFSLRQRLHRFRTVVRLFDDRIFQEMECSILLSLRYQMYLLSSVEFLSLL